MICGHEFEQGKTCNREISFRMGFKLGMCSPCYNLKQHKELIEEYNMKVSKERAQWERSVYEDMQRSKREREEKEKKEKKKKVVNVAIRHRLSKLGVRY